MSFVHNEPEDSSHKAVPFSPSLGDNTGYMNASSGMSLVTIAGKYFLVPNGEINNLTSEALHLLRNNATHTTNPEEFLLPNTPQTNYPPASLFNTPVATPRSSHPVAPPNSPEFNNKNATPRKRTTNDENDQLRYSMGTLKPQNATPSLTHTLALNTPTTPLPPFTSVEARSRQLVQTLKDLETLQKHVTTMAQIIQSQITHLTREFNLLPACPKPVEF